MLSRAMLCFLLLIVTSLANAAVGRTPGQFDVSADGEALYSVSLWTPPGTNKLTPSLSLQYSSGNPNGWIGVGFTVPGFSLISRCNRTPAQDGAFSVSQPQFTTIDKFCIDGNRLRLTSGSYGAANSVYQTEVESFRRITITGADTYGPTAFEVRTPEGLIYEYGNSASSKIRLLASSGTLSPVRLYWVLNKVRDRSNNYIEFTYTQDTAHGGYYPQEISWTGNDNGTAARYKAVFVNESTDRPDFVFNRMPYFGTEAIQQFDYYKRLSRIELYYTPSNSLIRSYNLTYAPQGGNGTHSVLKSLQECAAGGDCLAPTVFNWYDSTSTVTNTNSGITIPAGVTPFVMDINGDSRDDIVWSSTATSGTGTWRFMLANSTGGFGPAQDSLRPNTGFSQAQILEWDGDGKSDLIVPGAGGTWWVLRASGSGFAPAVDTTVAATFPAAFADINGDGLDDLVRKFNGLAVRLRSGANFGPESVALTYAWPVASIYPVNSKRHQDFDGDGLEDLVIRIDQIDAVGNHTLKTQTVFGAGTSLRAGLEFGAVTYVGSGDFNADGKTDIAYLLSGSIRTSVNPSAGPTAGSSQIIVDWDGDRKDDLLIADAGVWSMARSTGVGFSAPTSISISSNPAVAGDFDGDNFPDILLVNSNVIQFATHTTATPWPFREALQSVTDGFGLTASIVYGLLSDPLVHVPGIGTGYPFKDVSSPRALVRTVTATDGRGGTPTYTLNFKYEGGREDNTGRGMLGFAKRTVQDSRRPSIRTEQTFRQDYPYIGLTQNTSVRQNGSNTLVRDISSTLSAITYGSGGEVRQYPYVSLSVTDSYELGGTYNGTRFSSVQDTVNAIDTTSGVVSDSTITRTEVATGINPGSSNTHRTIVSIGNDVNSWCIGRPQTVQSIHSHTLTDGTAITRVNATTWDFSRCRPSQQQVEPGNTTWEATIAYGYDDDPTDPQGNFGNLTRQTISAASLPARITTYNWDSAGQFPTSVTNALSQLTQMGWDPALGLQTSETDPNGISISWNFDPFGRKIRENHADGTYSVWTRYLCSDSTGYCYYGDNTFYRVNRYDYGTDNNWFEWQIGFFDRYDRLTGSAFDNAFGAQVDQRIAYDKNGLIASRSAPFFITGGTPYFTSYSYDDLDRLTAVSRPISDSEPALQTQTTGYEGWTTRSVDARGMNTSRVSSVTGTLARAVDAEGHETDYRYNAFDQIVRVTDGGGNVVTTAGYNIRGMRVASTDADMGSWAFTPNALGEIVSQTDANGKITVFGYDALGRQSTRTEEPNTSSSVTTLFNWGDSNTARNIGRLASASVGGTTVTDNIQAYFYDSVGRLIQTRYSAEGMDYFVDQSYNAVTGLAETLTYPSSTSGYRLKLKYEYQNGLLYRISDFNIPENAFWRAYATDPYGSATDEGLGNGLRTTRGFDAVTGWIDYIRTGPGGGTSIQNLSYLFDRMGNLEQRQDNRQALTENFYYDNLSRLDYSTLNGVINLDLTYNSLGNVTNKMEWVLTFTIHPRFMR